MKKVKVMLFTTLVVAAVGAALAFKAKTYSTGLFCGLTTNSCTIQDNIHKLRFATPDDVAIPNVYCTDILQTPNVCVSVTDE